MARDDRRLGAEDRPAAADLHGAPRAHLRPGRSAQLSYTVKIRRGGRVERESFSALDPALDAIARAIARASRREPVEFLSRRYEPGDLVSLRIELAGGRVHAGVDVRGDGSAVAWTGRFRRTEVPLRGRETAIDALRRVLGGGGSGLTE